MKNLELMRNKIFWIYDAVRGGKVRAAYNDIKDILNNLDSERTKIRRQTYLQNLILHAVKTTIFYKDFHIRESLNSFPVINKNIIKENYDKFISNMFLKENLFHVTTSGSTGTPFTVYQDANKKIRHIADNVFFNEMANTCIGSKLYYFRIWNKIGGKSLFEKWAQNISTQEASDLSDINIQKFLKGIETDKSTKSILAYASTYEAIGNYVLNYEKKGFNSKINAVISMSETLPEKTRMVLSNYFSCPVVSRYSNMENGFIAQQCQHECGEYHINNASFFVELLDLDEDIPAKNGEFGRIVVTDLFNYAMPMIRYDTGDVGVMLDEPKCSFNTRAFKTIEGRKVDFLYNTEGDLLSPHVITNTMWKYREIKQFQFIQEEKNKYVFKINIDDVGYDIESDVTLDLQVYLGSDAEIKFEHVNCIPILNSGKFKKIICNYTPKPKYK